MDPLHACPDAVQSGVMTAVGTAVFEGDAASDELVRSIAEHAAAIRVDASVGVPAKSGQLVLAPAGLVVQRGTSSLAYRWGEVPWIGVTRGAVVIRVEAPRERTVTKKEGSVVQRYTDKRRIAFRLQVDRVDEPSIASAFSRVLEDMRASTFSFKGTPWIDYRNAIDRLHGAFDHEDDAVLPIAAAGLWVAVGLMLMFLVPIGVNAATVRTVPAGAFAISDPLGAFDPRSIIAGFALSAMASALVLRFALGEASTVWARGAVRGWAQPHGGRRARIVIRQVGHIVLAVPSAAVIVLIALLTFWPNIAAIVLVNQVGARNEVLLPFISLDEPWRTATSITRETGGAVTIHFADGRMVTTLGHELGGGNLNQYFEHINTWRAAAK